MELNENYNELSASIQRMYNEERAFLDGAGKPTPIQRLPQGEKYNNVSIMPLIIVENDAVSRLEGYEPGSNEKFVALQEGDKRDPLFAAFHRGDLYPAIIALVNATSAYNILPDKLKELMTNGFEGRAAQECLDAVKAEQGGKYGTRRCRKNFSILSIYLCNCTYFGIFAQM